MRIIRAGIFRPVEQLGHVRRENVARAAEDGTVEPGCERGESRCDCAELGFGLSSSRGVRTGTLASRISSSGIERELDGAGDAWAGPTAAPTATVLSKSAAAMATRVRVKCD